MFSNTLANVSTHLIARMCADLGQYGPCIPENLRLSCNATPKAIITSSYLIAAGIVVYFLVFLYFVWRGGRELQKRPYAEYRVGNLAHRLLVATASLQLPRLLR